MVLTDTHCHLDIEHFDADREAVLTRAWDSGLDRILIPALDIESAQRVLALADSDPRLFSAVGVHPNHAETWNATTLAVLKDLASHPKVVAIGEIGLDYYWNVTPKDVQLSVIQAQLDLAAELQMPVVIHNRDSTQDVINLLVTWQAELAASGNPLAKRPGVLHSYSGDEEAANRALAHNFYLGVTGPVTFKKSEALQKIFTNTPLQKILIETDSPYLTPQPYRGKRNEPANVRFVAEKIAELKGANLNLVAEQTSKNAAELFQWGTE